MKRIFISLFFFAFMWTAAGADVSPELLFVRWPANPDAVWYSFRIVPAASAEAGHRLTIPAANAILISLSFIVRMG